jgi:radical SAM protein with 4Fe4S-binding SPASM domain
MINPRVDCSQSPLAVRLPPEECVALDLADPKRSEEWIKFADAMRRGVEALPATGELYECGGGMNSFAVDPYGRMSICVLSEAHKYDLRSGSFGEGWASFLGAERRKRAVRPTKCVSCALKAVCGMCPANGELENGDPESPVDYLCHVAHLRAEALGLAVPRHGSCEYCEGGSRHAEISSAASRLRRDGRALERSRTGVSATTPDGRTLLRVVDVQAAGGCLSCAR